MNGIKMEKEIAGLYKIKTRKVNISLGTAIGRSREKETAADSFLNVTYKAHIR